MLASVLKILFKEFIIKKILLKSYIKSNTCNKYKNLYAKITTFGPLNNVSWD